jgi:molybdate transport system permease protein
MNSTARGRIFRISLFSMLGALSLYLAVLFIAMAGHLNFDDIPGILRSREILHAIQLTFVTATVSSLLALIMGLPCAYVLSRFRFRGRFVIDTLLDLPIVLSPVAVGTGILLLFQTVPGRWFSENVTLVVFSWLGIILAQFTVISALAIRLLKATFDEISPRYEKVARVMGCTPARVFFKVDLPMAKRGILSAWILTWARAVGEFGATVTVAGATAMKTETLSTSIYLHLSTVQISHAAFLMTLMVFIALGVLLVSRLVMRREVYE